MPRVFDNLFSNAVEAMPNCGILTVVTETRDNLVVTITVSDTGSGIRPQDIDQVFARFLPPRPVAAAAWPCTFLVVEGVLHADCRLPCQGFNKNITLEKMLFFRDIIHVDLIFKIHI